MGWWKADPETGGFADPEQAIEMFWGDGPADIMGSALEQIIAEFQEDWGRPPTEAELIAGLRFSLGPLQQPGQH